MQPPKEPKPPRNPDDPAEEKEEGEEEEEAEPKQDDEEPPPHETLKYARGRNSGYHICINVRSGAELRLSVLFIDIVL